MFHPRSFSGLGVLGACLRADTHRQALAVDNFGLGLIADGRPVGFRKRAAKLPGTNTVTFPHPFVVSLSNLERSHFDKLSANGGSQ